MNVLFEELERFTQAVVARLLALDGDTLAAPEKVKPVKVTNGTRAGGRPPKELNKAEAAAYVGVSTNTLDAWSKRGVIPAPHTKEGHRGHFFFKADLMDIERPKRGAA
jgi:hypothetical protein